MAGAVGPFRAQVSGSVPFASRMCMYGRMIGSNTHREDVNLMGVVMESAQWKTEKQLLKATERTNELLAELLVEVKHANELTRWQIEQRPPVA
jgi:hypothetical protein